MNWLLAHQGGWDEFLMFAVPAVLAVLGLRWAEKRSRARAAEKEAETSASEPTSETGPPPASSRQLPLPAGGGNNGEEGESPLQEEGL